MRFPEIYKVSQVLSDGDFNAAANLDFSSINMSKYHRAMFIIGIQDLAVASPVLYLYSGAAVDTLTSALTFHYAFGGAAYGTANSDVLAADGTSAALTITYGTYPNYMLIVEIEADKMDLANGEFWLTGRFVCTTATGNVQVNAILEPRYTGNLSISALV